jgi:hypothetical protein
MLALVGLGAVALLASKKKKKTTPEVVVPETVIPKPPPKPKPDSTRPMGNPPNPAGGPYDQKYWDASRGGVGREGIRRHFNKYGYPVDINDFPMNELGPKGTGSDIANASGSTGKLGGADDKPSAAVRNFQRHYNAVSRLGKSGAVVTGVKVPSNMGGLDEDGLVGPFTLNGVKYVLDSGMGEAGAWVNTFVKEAEVKGFMR